MTTFLIIIGIITLLIVGKFIYETRIERNKGKFNSSSKTKDQDKVEYMKNKGYEDVKRTIPEVIDNFLYENPTLKEISKIGDINMITDCLGENNDLTMSLLKDMAYGDNPAENYRQKAITKLLIGNDAHSATQAIQLINKGLTFKELNTEPLLYSLRSGCYYMHLNNNKEALNDINSAIESLNKNLPDPCLFYDFYLDRATIKEDMGDLNGAIEDRKLASEYRVECKSKK